MFTYLAPREFSGFFAWLTIMHNRQTRRQPMHYRAIQWARNPQSAPSPVDPEMCQWTEFSYKMAFFWCTTVTFLMLLSVLLFAIKKRISFFLSMNSLKSAAAICNYRTSTNCFIYTLVWYNGQRCRGDVISIPIPTRYPYPWGSPYPRQSQGLP